MNVIATDIPEVLIIEPELFGDQRGFFLQLHLVVTSLELGTVDDKRRGKSHSVAGCRARQQSTWPS